MLTRNKIRLDATKKSLLRLPFVTRVLEVAQEFFKSKNLKSNFFRVETFSFVFWESPKIPKNSVWDFCHTCLGFYYASGDILHTEHGNNSHTIDFHTVL